MSKNQTDRILAKARKALEPSKLPAAFNDAAPSSGDISHERLIAAYEVLASIISIHGEAYLPLFKRLHKEIESRKKNNELVEMARAIHGSKWEP